MAIKYYMDSLNLPYSGSWHWHGPECQYCTEHRRSLTQEWTNAVQAQQLVDNLVELAWSDVQVNRRDRWHKVERIIEQARVRAERRYAKAVVGKLSV